MPSSYDVARSRLESSGKRRTRSHRGAAARYWSLRAYFWALIGVFVVVAGAAAAYVHVQTGRDARAEAQQHAAFAATSAARQLADDIASLRASVTGLAATPDIAQVLDAPAAGCSLSYTASRGPRKDRGHIDIIRADGTPVCSSQLPPEPKRVGLYGGSAWLAQARERQLLTAPVVDPASGHHVAVVAAPIAGGVVAAFLDLTAVGPHLAERYGGARSVVLIATGDRRRVLARSIEPQRWIGTSLQGTAFASASSLVERRDLNGRERLYGEATVPGVGWLLTVGEDKAAALVAQSRLEKRQFAIIGVGLLLLLAATATIRRRVAWPIEQLGNELRASGLRGQPVPVSVPTACPGEVRALADDVNVLIESVNTELQARKQTASALHRSEETYRQLFELHPAAMYVFDPETLRFVAVNEAAVATYGYTRQEFLSMTISDIRPSEDRELLREAIEAAPGGRVAAGVWRHLRQDGTLLEVAVLTNEIEFEGKPARLVLAEDVTEKNQLQRQLQHMYKMEAVGQLAGGIAHDFNNLLTVIDGFSALAVESLATADAPAAVHIQEVQRAAGRASDLTQQLLAYSRQQVLQKTPLDLNCVVRESESLLSRVIGEDVVITTDLADDLGHVLADEGQVSQVLMNLAVNARDAMPRGGRLTIRTRNAELGAAAAGDLWGAPPGEYVVLEVADNGIGMDEETKEHLFEPFFTTKPVGRGTGLGLSTVFGIVKQSGGYIKAESQVGAGTTFTIYLPRNETALAGKEPSVAAAPGVGKETILVVEDEPVVRTLIEKMLSARGYDVVAASDPDEALRLSREHEIDAVVTDVVMPSMNGRVLVEHLRREQPDLRALFTSGYTSDAVLERGISEAEVAFVQKPFTAETLAARLRQLLDG
jgi:PAS domain S-box-containing protein